MEDTIDTVGEIPSSKITITYPNGKTVEFGQELTPTEVKDQPKVSWDADPNKYYTLIMYDPDVPSRKEPTLADMQHWLVVNIKGCDLSSGEEIAAYLGSGAPQGNGLIRYIFLVFEQKSGKITFDEPKSPKNSRANRRMWSMKKFRDKYGLGKAYAGNYFTAQWDPYVEERNKILQKQSC